MCDYEERRAEHNRQQLIAQRIRQGRHIEQPLICHRCGEEVLADRTGKTTWEVIAALEAHWDICTPDWRLERRERELVKKGIPECLAPTLAAMIELSPSSERGGLTSAPFSTHPDEALE